MKAVIMAGGEGTRLRPLTLSTPKPMLPIANVPMMEHIVRLLREHGFDEIVVTVAFLAQNIRTYFGDGSEFGVRIRYAVEDSPMGTAGSVRNARAELDERFLVISGDVLTDIDLGAVVAEHDRRGAMATIALKKMENPVDFGIVITDGEGRIERFLEKPTWGEVFSDTINTGIYVLEPEVFDYIGEGQVDFSSDVFPKLLEEGKPLFGAVVDGYWEDVGTLESYVSAHGDALDAKVAVQLPGFEMSPRVWVGAGADVHPDARIDGPCIIGHDCRVDAGAHLAPYTVLGDNVRVGADSYIERSVVHDNSHLGRAVRLRGAIVGRRGDLRYGSRCEEDVVLGDECFVGEHAVINQGVKVYPFKTVEPGAVVNASLVWESRGARSLFGRDGVSGLANVDLSPELALRVAMAFATGIKKGQWVTTSRDSSRAGRVLKRAVMVGLNAAGLNVDDLELATAPLARFHARNHRHAGSITVRLSADDPEKVSMRFFDSDGIDLAEGDQRKIERLYHREDFRRVVAHEIGDIGFAPRAIEHYTAALLETIDVQVVAERRLKLVLDLAYGATSLVLPSVLAKANADVLVVNPYTATSAAATFDAAAHAANVANLVRSSGADLGAVLSPDGERILLVDDQGHVFTGEQTQLAFITMSVEGGEGPIALPVDTPSEAAAIATKAGVDIVWTKRSNASLLEAAHSNRATLAADRRGGVAFPRFLPAFDGVAALLHVMHHLARVGESLSGLRMAISMPAIAEETVVTPWERKGAVMREMVERNGDRPLDLIDGVKVLLDNGWVLVVPDPEEPATLVMAEAPTESEAVARAQEYARRIRQLLR
ncbi:MAG: mannose-phosphate guanylyltransferase / phosphomannomutase [Actinomycetota bacterium]|jgi:mannose-1-phosphate guanylyltransferase/phosphomannomutase